MKIEQGFSLPPKRNRVPSHVTGGGLPHGIRYANRGYFISNHGGARHKYYYEPRPTDDEEIKAQLADMEELDQPPATSDITTPPANPK